jgi:putative oxidoreductase
MLDYLDRYKPQAYALFRIVFGLLFAFHGAQKALGLYREGFPPDFVLTPFTQVWFGAWIELLGGALVMLGLWTRPAAFLCSGTMAVAYAQFHWKGQLGAQFWPAVNHGEAAVLFCWAFFHIACAGDGLWSLGRRR